MATRKSEDVAKEKLIDSVKTSLNDAESFRCAKPPAAPATRPLNCANAP